MLLFKSGLIDENLPFFTYHTSKVFGDYKPLEEFDLFIFFIFSPKNWQHHLCNYHCHKLMIYPLTIILMSFRFYILKFSQILPLTPCPLSPPWSQLTWPGAGYGITAILSTALVGSLSSSSIKLFSHFYRTIFKMPFLF